MGRALIITVFLIRVIAAHVVPVEARERFTRDYQESATKNYYEVIQITGKDANGSDVTRQLKFEEVADKAEAVQKNNDIPNRVVLLGKKYKAYYHVHRHGENGNNRPCTLELIEEN